jgi:ATP-dependent DNA ligase
VQADIRIIQTKVFASGYSLRFPRMTRIRDDKSCREVMTLDQLQAIVAENKGAITGTAQSKLFV